MGVIPGLFTIPWGITCHSQFFSNALYPLRKSQSGAETVMLPDGIRSPVYCRFSPAG